MEEEDDDEEEDPDKEVVEIENVPTPPTTPLRDPTIPPAFTESLSESDDDSIDSSDENQPLSPPNNNIEFGSTSSTPYEQPTLEYAEEEDQSIPTIEALARQVRFLIRDNNKRKAENEALEAKYKRLEKRIKTMDDDLSLECDLSCTATTDLAGQVAIKNKLTDKHMDLMEQTFGSVYEILSDRLDWSEMDERPSEAIGVLKKYGTTPPSGSQDPSDDSQYSLLCYFLLFMM